MFAKGLIHDFGQKCYNFHFLFLLEKSLEKMFGNVLNKKNKPF